MAKTELEELNGYDLSRAWFNWCFENPELVNPNHTAIYFFAIEHCNRLGWKSKFGFPTQMAMDALGIKKHQTYIKYFNQLVDWGFIKLVQKSQNQYSSNVISLMVAMPKNGKALDKAFIKHRAKQTEPTGQSTGQSNSSVDKQRTKNKEPLTTNKELPDGSYQIFLKIYSDWYQDRVGVGIAFDGVQGKALKGIVTYLTANSKEKNCAGGAAAWEYILVHWDKLEPFLRDQIKVNQIQSNLPNILNQLKNGNSKAKPANNQNNIHAGIDALLAR